MTRFADIAQGLLHMEMDLHRSYAGELGISSAQLEREEMLPTTQGYTDFLVRTAALGDFAELTDHAGEDVGAAGRERARRAFLISSRYELAFWQMAWAGERWPA